jgi:hypothetical protein
MKKRTKYALSILLIGWSIIAVVALVMDHIVKKQDEAERRQQYEESKKLFMEEQVKARAKQQEEEETERRSAPVRKFINTLTQKDPSKKQRDPRARFLKAHDYMFVSFLSNLPCSLIEKTLGPADHRDSRQSKESRIVETTFTYDISKTKQAYFECWTGPETPPSIYQISFENETITANQWSLKSK